jgi:hypothetical protein
MVDFDFQNFDVARLYARLFSIDVGSQKVLQKCGFKLRRNSNKSFAKIGLFGCINLRDH